MIANPLVLKLGLVRFATSLLVVLLVNVLNRVLIVDLGVAATLVTFCFAFQHVMTPTGLVSGYCSDAFTLAGRHRAPYIWGGMLLSLAVMPFFPSWALAMGAEPYSYGRLGQGILLFSLFGIGTTTSATAINALLVDRLPEADRGPALTLLWILTLGGFIAGSWVISILLPTYDPQTLDRVFWLVVGAAALIALGGAWGVEPRESLARPPRPHQLDLWHTLRFLGGNGQSLLFFAFLLASVFFLAIQTFILTAFGGEVLGLPVGLTSRFGMHLSYGVILGMTGLHLFLSRHQRRGDKPILAAGLAMGALALGLLSFTSFRPHPLWGLSAIWFLGIARGLYNVGISHLTMNMAHPLFSGIFMGLWNLVSGLALAAGEMVGGTLKDQLFQVTGTVQGAYGWLFLLEGLGLLACMVFLVPLQRDKYHLQLAMLLAQKTTPAYPVGTFTQGARHPDETR